MDANEFQVGGDHYAKPYQHWDFVLDCELNYLDGCSTKYISRWKDKNGLQDLRKALHYISKAIECGLAPKMKFEINRQAMVRFCSQLGGKEFLIIELITIGEYERAQNELNLFIAANEIGEEPSSSYVNQD